MKARLKEELLRSLKADMWDEGWRVGRSDGRRQMVDHAHPRTANPYRDTAGGAKP